MKRVIGWFWLLALLLGACMPSAGSVGSDTAGLNLGGSLSVGGLQRSYRLHLPGRAVRGAGLVLALHGGGGSGAGMRSLSGLDAVADQAGFVVAYPDGLQKNWADGRGTTEPERAGVDDVAFLRALAQKLVSELKLDAARVFVAGISNGGFMAARLACDAADVFAAVAVVAATLPQVLQSQCVPVRAVSVLLVHGSADPIVPAAGGTMTKGDGGEILSLAQAFGFWRNANACVDLRAERFDRVEDGTSVELERATACQAGAEVLLYRVLGGGHTWPGGEQYLPVGVVGRTSREFIMNDVALGFFAAHPLR